jgi:hypothetical protein
MGLEEGTGKRERNCRDQAAIIKRIAGWITASVFHHYFGEGSLVLLKEGSQGEDLEFYFTDRWMEENQITNYATEVEADLALSHVYGCDSPICKETKVRFEIAGTMFKRGIPDGMAIASVVHLKGRGAKCEIGRENGFGPEIDRIKPQLMWFIDDRDFWKWPD